MLEYYSSDGGDKLMGCFIIKPYGTTIHEISFIIADPNTMNGPDLKKYIVASVSFCINMNDPRPWTMRSQTGKLIVITNTSTPKYNIDIRKVEELNSLYSVTDISFTSGDAQEESIKDSIIKFKISSNDKYYVYTLNLKELQ